MELYNFIYTQLKNKIPIYLLVVVKSKGSSPGRQGFKMAVAKTGEIFGTIGGGIMEFKLVEKAKSLLNENQLKVELQHQFHDKVHAKNQSGMICSGMQSIAFVPLQPQVHTSFAEQIVSNKVTGIKLSQNGIAASENKEIVFFEEEDNWWYNEPLFTKPVVHIIGAGHCALALSQQLNWLNFHVKLYDDRKELNTYNDNHFAHEKFIINYANIHPQISIGISDYVVIMTIGYRTDKLVLKQIINTPCKYLGLLGSPQKIATLFKELNAEGISELDLQKVFSPIGLPINSKTTAEIAVSIAAQIIDVKNNKVLL